MSNQTLSSTTAQAGMSVEQQQRSTGIRFIPGSPLLAALGAGAVGLLLALSLGASLAVGEFIFAALLISLGALASIDRVLTLRAWKAASPALTRRLPQAFALGVERPIELAVSVGGEESWRVRLFDHADASCETQGMPVDLELRGGRVVEARYHVKPRRRGEIAFEPADVRVRSRLGLLELLDRLGEREQRRVYPDFAQIARYAWLAGDRRLSEMGIKTFQQRGEGTDFKQLAEYRIGDPLRRIDWKATLKHEKPIVRQFQNERDQYVILLIDCGRRMRADDRASEGGAAHFDQVLNASMLLTYVALKQGDAVGALTFGVPAGDERWVPPRKGGATLNLLMNELYSVQPSASHSDYLAAAQDLLRRHYKRSLVIFVTNFRDEDAGELGQALKLLRTRHLALTASLRERIVRELMSQGAHGDASLEVAAAHLYEQSRRDAFNRIAARDALMLDAEPQRLGVELVNRYQAVKNAGLI